MLKQRIDNILNVALFVLGIFAAALMMERPYKIGIGDPPAPRPAIRAPAAVSIVSSCAAILATWRYMNTCAPPEWDDLPPQLNCPYDRPPNVASEPVSYAVARAMRDRYREQLLFRGCLEEEARTAHNQALVEAMPELNGEERAERLGGLKERAGGGTTGPVEVN